MCIRNSDSKLIVSLCTIPVYVIIAPDAVFTLIIVSLVLFRSLLVAMLSCSVPSFLYLWYLIVIVAYDFLLLLLAPYQSRYLLT